jgi:hypothetical protein
MSQKFLRNGRWLTAEQLKDYNNPKEITHEVTEEEVIENNLEGIVEVGEEVVIPAEEELKPKAKKSNKK